MMTAPALWSTERCDMEWVRLPQIVAVDGTVAKGEEGRERGVDDVGGDQVEQHVPAGVACVGTARDE